ncbi:4-hydroxy-2-oxoheptanedioate aldolase [Paracoccus halophilus]|uniref:2,4-dihydroxyhept-2-ene-1,7-dioic acid aldolase n=1 Tax=Paracoccus halophilus TaxID=376733 RepID=A0A099EXW7_9RHOB|nr:aldolase/citrate lyase family protein [Paracoccus halophilus]KGJ02836.1 2,4-dihydroxyhept-2-ene-1,7-dioic acid aldolase [Paracoccus halophilus]SFA60238.1 4-hydroxy-2-oxoheptanedioate aldolase [Paracoccus halophilus]
MFRNKLRQIWAEGKPALNGWLSIGSPFTAEIMAAQGYDSVSIDIQHGALDYGSLLPMLQAMRASGVTPMARVPWREPGIIMKALDAGAQGIICPMINSAEEAAEFVSYMRYPPHGQRSFGPTRAAIAYGGYGVQANDEVLALAMIETAQGVANLDAISATPGLDGIYVGPADLTLGTQNGRLPPAFDREEPEMIDLIKQVVDACKRNEIRACLHCGTPAYAARAIGWGFDLTTVSGDSRLLAAAASASVREWRDLTGGDGVSGDSTKGVY